MEVSVDNININESNNPFKHWWFTIKRSFDFKGRSSRKEFWMFYTIVFFFSLIVGRLYLYSKSVAGQNIAAFSVLISIIFIVFFLVSNFSYIALVTRRFHDVDGSAWITLLYYGCILLSAILGDVAKHIEQGNIFLNLIIIVIFIIIVIVLRF